MSLSVSDKITALRQIIRTGSCGINPPIMGWLVETGVITPTGFDVTKAQELLEQEEQSK